MVLLAPDVAEAFPTQDAVNEIIDDVPAYICEQCSQPLFTEEAVELVQEMIRNLDATRQELDAILVPA